MKIFIACLATETNTFSPVPTGWSAWNQLMKFWYCKAGVLWNKAMMPN